MSDILVQPEVGSCTTTSVASITDTDSVTYTGSNLTCLAINTNDNLTTAFAQLEAKCNTTDTSITTINTNITTINNTIAALATDDIDNSGLVTYNHLTTIQPTDTLDDILGDIDAAFVTIAAITDLFNFTSNTLGDTMYFDGTDFVNTNTLFNNATNVGIGKTSSFSAKFEVEAASETGRFTRTSSDTTTTRTVLVVKHKTDQNMADGFGACIDFIEEDDTTAGSVARVCGIRDGADDSGALTFFTFTTGTANEAMRITSTQSVIVGGTSANVSALFQIDSTTKGFLKPRMTTTQRNAVGSPTAGLEIYNTTTNTPQYYNGSAWTDVTGSGTDLTGLGVDHRVMRWNGTDTAQSSDWFIDDAGVLYPNTDGQDIGLTGTNRIGTIYMTSTIDFGSQLILSESGAERMKITGSGNVLIGAGSEDGTALLQMDSTTTGFLKPRMTTVQRDAIVTPATGLEIYNTTTGAPEYYNGSAWGSINGIYGGSGSLSGATTITMGTDDLFFQSTETTNLFTLKDGKVGINNNAPAVLVHLTSKGTATTPLLVYQSGSVQTLFQVSEAAGGYGSVLMQNSSGLGTVNIAAESTGAYGLFELSDAAGAVHTRLTGGDDSYIDLDAGKGIGIGRNTVQANNRVTVRGEDTSGSKYALRLEDSGGALIADFRNDKASRFNGKLIPVTGNPDIGESGNQFGKFFGVRTILNGGLQTYQESAAGKAVLSSTHQSDSSNNVNACHFTSSNTASDRAEMVFARSNGTISARTVITDTSEIGRITWGGYDGTDYEPAALIKVVVDGSVGAGDIPGQMILQVQKDGGSLQDIIRLHESGYAVIRAEDAAIADADLNNGEIAFYLNEAGNTLTVKAKYSGGTVKTGTVALT